MSRETKGRAEHDNRKGRESVRKRIGKRIARGIAARDGSCCAYCGQTEDESGYRLQLDHLTPREVALERAEDLLGAIYGTQPRRQAHWVLRALGAPDPVWSGSEVYASEFASQYPGERYGRPIATVGDGLVVAIDAAKTIEALRQHSARARPLRRLLKGYVVDSADVAAL